jgi:hypothetical protein
MEPESGDRPSKAEEFTRQSQLRRHSLIGDLLFFIRNTKKYWLLPLIVLLLCFSLLMVLATSGAAPFIYTLF